MSQKSTGNQKVYNSCAVQAIHMFCLQYKLMFFKVPLPITEFKTNAKNTFKSELETGKISLFSPKFDGLYQFRTLMDVHEEGKR